MPNAIIQREPRSFAKRGDAIEVPDLIKVQIDAYKRFLQQHTPPNEREPVGLEALLREVFPIESYDGNTKLDYVSYALQEPRYTIDECRALRLTYGMPFRIRVRLTRKDVEEVVEDDIFVGEIPVMIGGGEFIVNGAERVIVNQLHRSPGIDFLIEEQEGDRPLHGFRVIPERGSWIECSVTKKDALVVRIDQSAKIPATAFVRALDERFGEAGAIVQEFYDVEHVKPKDLKPEYYSAQTIVDAETGEETLKAGAQIGDKLETLQASDIEKVAVVTKVSDPLILNTLAEDIADSHDEAIIKIYSRLRPGNPPQLEKARTLFKEKFFDESRYRLGRVGRFRVNRKFEQNIPESEMVLRSEDFVNSLKYMFALRDGKGYIDDIDHLGNRRLRLIDELATEEIRKGFLKLKRTVQERMSLKDPNELGKVAELVNSKAISSAIDFFFGRGELSQVVDQTNPLSQLTHERRLSALGPGGLNRKRAGFEVRDVHISHYGRICPIETPEGTNIGLIASLSIYADIDEYGFLITPYRVVKNGKVNGDVQYLRADEEMKGILAPPDAVEIGSGKVEQGLQLARVEGDLSTVGGEQIQYVDISPKQTVSVSAALIPFLEHDDANRALMGSNMQRQAVPLLKVDPPCVGTGLEKSVAKNSGMIVRAERPGTVTYVDAERILIDNADEYELRKFKGTTDKTCQNQRPLVKKGQKVKKGQIIADGASTHLGELALGKNALVAFMTFDGYNFEDAIVINERLVKDDTFTSIHIEEYGVEIRETKLGKEEFTRDIPNVSERSLGNLDEHGVVRVGTRVGPGDILVGKISPKSKSELTPEEKLLHAIFGRAGEDVKNDSLELPAGEEGVVVGAKRFSRRMHQTEEQKRTLKKEIETYEAEMDQKAIAIFREMIEEINAITGSEMVDPNTRQKVAKSDIDEVIIEQIEEFDPGWVKGSKEKREEAVGTYSRFWPRVQAVLKEKARKTDHMKRGDELPSGVLEMVKVYIATKRTLSVGDKMAGRHGNKGVIARIVPEEDMPFLEDGTPVDVCLNPLGVPSRMNVGQILETHLGWAMQVLGQQAVTPVFDGATEDEVFEAVSDANKLVEKRLKEHGSGKTKHLGDRELAAPMPYGGKVQLYDGRSGEPFEQKTTVGFMYMLKLHHLVDDKIHARATGPYSLITQQPLGGKARTGGQRFGEMEVWGLEAYGAAYIRQDILTVKSDDVEGRTKIYESMVKGQNTLEAGTPVSFDVLCNEIRGLGLNIQLEKKAGAEGDDDLL
ncbi:MAG: DNA-directed RNA polymerase subunit beta [Planctomycetota bacterium]